MSNINSIENIKVLEIFLGYSFFSWFIVLFLYSFTKVYNTILQRNNCIEEQKSLPWPNEDEKEKIINETELNRHLKSEYYFTEDFYKLIPKYQKSLLEDYTEFGQYVATELQLINKDENKEKLKTEIRKLIAEIVADDRHSLFKDFIEDEETDDVNIEE